MSFSRWQKLSERMTAKVVPLGAAGAVGAALAFMVCSLTRRPSSYGRPL